MSYTAIEKQIHAVPEEYLDDISEFIDYILFKINRDQKTNRKFNTSNYYGCISRPIDGMEFQRNMRDEWN